jgi:hypothetical protein
VLAIAGAAGGLHVLNAVVILGIGGMLTYRAWRVDRVQPAAPTPVAAQAEPAATRPGSD